MDKKDETMDKKTILVDFIKEKLIKDGDKDIEFTEDTPLISNQLLDSFALVTLSNFISVQFNVDMRIRYMVKKEIDTVKQIVEDIESR